jgi:hypothetical protein
MLLIWLSGFNMEATLAGFCPGQQQLGRLVAVLHSMPGRATMPTALLSLLGAKAGLEIFQHQLNSGSIPIGLLHAETTSSGPKGSRHFHLAPTGTSSG